MAENLRQPVSTNHVSGEERGRILTGDRLSGLGTAGRRSRTTARCDPNRQRTDTRRRRERIVGIPLQRCTAVGREGIAARKLKTGIRRDDHLFPPNTRSVTIVEEFQAGGCRFPGRRKIERNPEREKTAGPRRELVPDL